VANLAIPTEILCSSSIILVLLTSLGGTALHRSSAMNTTVGTQDAAFGDLHIEDRAHDTTRVCRRLGRIRTNVGTNPNAVIAAMVHHPR
jgi:hypothetical protein